MGLISNIEDKLSGNSGQQADKQAEKQAQSYVSGQHGRSGGGLQQQAERQYAKHEMSSAVGGSGGNSSGLSELEQKAQGLSLGGSQGASGATGAHGAPAMTSGSSVGYGASSGSGITSQTAERYGAPGTSGYTSGTTDGYGSSDATSGVTGGAPTAAGVGAAAGAAGAGLSRDGSSSLRHPVGSGGQGGYIPPTGPAVNNPAFPGNGGQRVTSGSSQASTGIGSTKTQATEPYDPYSSAGQRTAADAAPNVGSAGYGQAIAHDQPRTSYDEQGIPRTAHGGISNSAAQPVSNNDRNFISGPTSYMSNPEAVPTAGGRTIGNDSHTGRDAALGAGAAGIGAYGIHEEQKHGHHHGHHGHHGQSSSTEPSSTSGVLHQDDRHTAQGQPDTIGRSYEQTPSSTRHHYGRDAAISAGAVSAGAYGVHEADQHHGRHAQGDTIRQQAQTQPGLSNQNFAGQGVGSSHPLGNQGGVYNQSAADAQSSVPGGSGIGSTTIQPTQSSSTSFDPKKLASAYEAGYRDALAHMEAERQRLAQQ